MTHRWRGLAVGAVLGLGLSTTTLAGPASAAVACGSTITTDTTLTTDLVGCTNNGLLVAADNVTLDLNGHTISGTPAAGDGAGVLVSGRHGVTVRHGTVTAFDAGVVVDGGSGNTVMQMYAHDNIGDVTDTFSTDFGDGILVRDSSGNVVQGNLADHNGPFDGIGVLGNSDNNQVIGNVSQNNNLPDARPGHENGSGNLQEDDGIRLETYVDADGGVHSPDNNLVRGNSVSNNGLDGIAVFPLAHDNTLDANSVSGNGLLGTARPGDGIHIFGRAQRTVVTTNRVTGNARDGIRVDFTNLVTFASPPANQIIRNVSVLNDVSDQGFPGFDLADQNRFCDSDVWQQNQFFTHNNPGSDCIH